MVENGGRADAGQDLISQVYAAQALASFALGPLSDGMGEEVKAEAEQALISEGFIWRARVQERCDELYGKKA
jgi:hypothetical protein